MFECVTTNYQTLETRIDHSATRYHNFKALLDTLLLYILSQFSMAWGYLQRVTMRYSQIYIKMCVNIFLKKVGLTTCCK